MLSFGSAATLTLPECPLVGGSQRLEPAYRIVAKRPQHPTEAKKIQNEFKLSPLISAILASRDFKANEELFKFLQPTLADLPNPVLGTPALKNLVPACERIIKALRNGEKIALASDFDCDGISGAAQVFRCLRAYGSNCAVFIPDRFSEGYGLNSRIVDQVSACGATLLITIDFGSTNHAAIERARALGVDVIVLDHHSLLTSLPNCILINPHQEGCGFEAGRPCGAGLSWYLTAWLSRMVDGSQAYNRKAGLAIAALGTIADIVPLRGGNRIIAKFGLEELSASNDPGIKKLIRIFERTLPLNTGDVGFYLAPAINAAGRVKPGGGKLAFDFLTTTDQNTARRLAEELYSVNAERQGLEQQVVEAAETLLYRRGSAAPAAFIWDESFHIGVVGLAAQRVSDRYDLPAAIVGPGENGIWCGSVRAGREGIHVMKILDACKRYFISYGGHPAAGGFKLRFEDLPACEREFAGASRLQLNSLNRQATIYADAEVSLGLLNEDVIVQLMQLGPFGLGNPAPQLLIRGLAVNGCQELNGGHLKLSLTNGRKQVSGFLWRHTQHPALKRDTAVDLVCRPEINAYAGRREIQLDICALSVASR